MMDANTQDKMSSGILGVLSEDILFYGIARKHLSLVEAVRLFACNKRHYRRLWLLNLMRQLAPDYALCLAFMEEIKQYIQRCYGCVRNYYDKDALRGAERRIEYKTIYCHPVKTPYRQGSHEGFLLSYSANKKQKKQWIVRLTCLCDLHISRLVLHLFMVPGSIGRKMVLRQLSEPIRVRLTPGFMDMQTFSSASFGARGGRCHKLSSSSTPQSGVDKLKTLGLLFHHFVLGNVMPLLLCL